MHRRLPTLAVAAMFPVAVCVGQTTHVVGPGGLKQITEAIARASPGDTILVASGWYNHFSLRKGLTIRARPSAAVVIFEPFGPGLNRFAIPEDQRAEIVGLRFDHNLPFPNLRNRYVTQVANGKIAFRNCRFVSSGVTVPGNPALEVVGGDVVLRECELLGSHGGSALRVTGATVAATRTLFRGGDGAEKSFSFGGSAVELLHATLHASHFEARGGSAPNTLGRYWCYDAGHGIHIRGNGSRLWLTDGSARGGIGGPCNGNRGGDGIRNETTTAVPAARVLAIAGAGQTPGLAVRGPWDPSAALLSIRAASGPALGSTFDVDFAGATTAPIAALLSSRFDRIDTPLLHQPLWIDPQALQVAGLGAGRLRTSVRIPNDVRLRGWTLWISGIANAGPPFAATSPAGGQIW